MNEQKEEKTVDYIKRYDASTDEEKDRLLSRASKDLGKNASNFTDHKIRLSKMIEEIDYYRSVLEASVETEDDRYTKNNVEWIEKKSRELKDLIDKFIL